LFFIDQLNVNYPKRDDITETAIVDHNQLDPAQEEWLGKNVTRIVDHHIDNNCYNDTLKEKECHFVGSACSLIAKMF
jgi:inorganic pyrophosphatase/exopolyphosphatase